jgi:uncharacterized protein (DUF1330 family)
VIIVSRGGMAGIMLQVGAHVTLVVILTVRSEALEQFRAFEAQAAAVMTTHGGRIERTVVVAEAGSPAVIKEVHIVTFPSAEAFRAYRADERLSELAHLRDASVIHTDVLAGEDGPHYGPS